MRQKTITVNYRVRANNEDVLESLIEEYEDNVEDLISLFTGDKEGQITATYRYGDQEINAYFYDNEIWDGIMRYSMELIQEGRIYTLHPNINDIQRLGNLVTVEMTVNMPWTTLGAPSVSEIEQIAPVTESLLAEKIFSAYSPLEVYRASYVYRKWGGVMEDGESELFDKKKQLIDFDKFNRLPINQQDRLANNWQERMEKTSVDNPTNPGMKMSVPIDLSAYDTSWKELDLNDEILLDLIETENKMLAVFIRMRRSGFRGTPEEFIEEMGVEDINESLMKRMHYIYDNNRL